MEEAVALAVEAVVATGAYSTPVEEAGPVAVDMQLLP